MHEFAIVTGIVESVTEFVEARSGVVVLKVRLLIGELTCVDAEQLRFCYNSITTETKLDGSELEVEILPCAVKCKGCHYEGPPKYWDGAVKAGLIPTLECPQCGHATEATRGHECQIKSVLIRQPEGTGNSEFLQTSPRQIRPYA